MYRHTYEPSGGLGGLTYGNGITLAPGHDLSGRMAAVDVFNGGTADIVIASPSQLTAGCRRVRALPFRASFNKPTRMENSVTGAVSEFTYGPSRARVKQTTLDGVTVTKTTTYIGGDFERVAFAAGPDELVHYIRAGGDRVAIYTKLDDGAPATDKTRYLHKDHLGSIDLVTDEAGLAADTRSFDPWAAPATPTGPRPPPTRR